MFWKKDNIFNDIYTDQNLNTAWSAIRSNGKVPGADGISVQQYQSNLFVNMKELQKELETKKYRPQPIKRFSLTKPDGSKRVLGILTVKDKIVQRALYQILEPVFEKSFEDISYGYRRNRGVKDAIKHLERHVDKGNHWVAHCDISRFFDNIDTERLCNEIASKVNNQMILKMIDGWLNQEATFNKKQETPSKQKGKGILQGSILSPLFGNIYLDRFDKKAIEKGLNIVRYSDNIILVTRNRYEVKKELNIVRRLLRELELHVNERKSITAHIESGVTFLGKRVQLFKSGKSVSLSIRDTQKPQLR